MMSTKRKPAKLSQVDWAKIRHECYERDVHCCVWCGRYVEEEQAHPHHIVFRSQGGANAKENIATLCVACHRAIHDLNYRTLERSLDSGEMLTKSDIVTILLKRTGENQRSND